MVGYRNAVYLPKDEMVRLFTWDDDGNRIHIDSTYNPYLYIEAKSGKDGVSLYNTPLKRVRFRKLKIKIVWGRWKNLGRSMQALFRI